MVQVSVMCVCVVCFRGCAAGLGPSAGGDTERPLIQPGHQPRNNIVQEQTSDYYRQDQACERGREVKPTL